MRPVLLVSIALATLAVGAAAYPFVGPRTSSKAAVPVVAADPSPVRTIPLSEGGAPRPRRIETASADAGAAWVEPARKEEPKPGPAVAEARMAPQAASGADAKPDAKPDVLASVGETLASLREASAAPTGGLSPTQEEALRRMAARRKVRPVTKTSFPLEAGAAVPPAVYLHPVPPEVAGLASGNLGFALVGNRAVVVSVDSRQVVAVGGN